MTEKKSPQSKKLTKLATIKKLAGIKALILDVDGVLTDDFLYFGSGGFELKKFHIGDGLAIVLAMKFGLEVIIMSNRFSPATASRMKDLRVKHVIQERGNKAEIVRAYLKKKRMKIKYSECAFVGNDIMDITLVRAVAVGIAVGNAVPDLKKVADFVTKADGGNGAVREIVEMYFKGNGRAMQDFFWK